MGLRLVAHYFDRVDAMIARSVVEGAGCAAFTPNWDLLTLKPGLALACSGFRLMVVEQELDEAVHALRHADLFPAPAAEKMVRHADYLDRVLSLLFGYLSGGAPCAFFQSRWEPIDSPPVESKP